MLPGIPPDTLSAHSLIGVKRSRVQRSSLQVERFAGRWSISAAWVNATRYLSEHLHSWTTSSLRASTALARQKFQAVGHQLLLSHGNRKSSSRRVG